MRRLAALGAAATVVLVMSTSSASGTVKPHCGAAGSVTSYCATWQTSGFGETSLEVDDNASSGTVTSFTFSMDIGSNTLTSVTSQQGASCSVHGRAEVSCTTGLQTGYSATVVMKTATALDSAHDGMLVFYLGPSPGAPQPAQTIALQGVTAPAQPSNTFLARAKEKTQEADHALELAVNRIRLAFNIKTKQEEQDDEAIARALLGDAYADLKAAYADLRKARSNGEARNDLVTAIGDASKAEMEMKVTDEADFSPAKVAPELEDALKSAEAAAGAM